MYLCVPSPSFGRFLLNTQCLWFPLVQKIVIPAHQQGKKSRDPQRNEFIKSVGQLGQLIMLLSWTQGGGKKEEAKESGGEGKKEKESLDE